jgi:hypothetical protein
VTHDRAARLPSLIYSPPSVGGDSALEAEPGSMTPLVAHQPVLGIIPTATAAASLLAELIYVPPCVAATRVQSCTPPAAGEPALGVLPASIEAPSYTKGLIYVSPPVARTQAQSCASTSVFSQVQGLVPALSKASCQAKEQNCSPSPAAVVLPRKGASLSASPHLRNLVAVEISTPTPQPAASTRPVALRRADPVAQPLALDLQEGPVELDSASPSSPSGDGPAPGAPCSSGEPAADVAAVRQPLGVALPRWELPAAHRRGTLCSSILSQLDGMLWAWGRIRPEADVCAFSRDESCCARGRPKAWESLAAQCCLFFHDPRLMPQVVAAAASHKAMGLFIVPEHTSVATELVYTKGARRGWHEVLLSHALVTFGFAPSAIQGIHGYGTRVLAVLAQFGLNNKPKRRRPAVECHYNLAALPGAAPPRLLPVIPVLLHRKSPSVDDRQPVLADDNSPAAALFVVPPDLVLPVPPAPAWAVAKVRALTTDFPFPEVRRIALEAMDGSYNPFVGDLDKAVTWPERSLSEEDSIMVYDICMKYVEKGFTWGPSKACPFKAARPYPPGLARKHKYVQGCTEMRLTSDVSAGRFEGAASVNALTLRADWLTVHFSVRFFGDMAAFMGAGTSLSTGDVRDAFKLNPNNPALLPLFTLFVESRKYGPAYFTDLVHCFGWVGAELSYQAQTALLAWIGSKSGLGDVKWYVDNYFFFHGPSDDGVARTRKLNVLLGSLGLPIHKCTAGFKGPVLGFEADLAYSGPEGPQVLILPLDKFECYRRDFAVWGAMSSISLEDIERALGVAGSLSQVIPASRAFSECMYTLKCQALLKQKRMSKQLGGRGVPSNAVPMRMQPPAVEFFLFWNTVMASWNRVAPIVQGFGPRGGPQCRIWVDSSPGTSSAPPGVGGIFWQPGAKELLGFYHAFSPAEVALFNRGQAPSAPVCEAMGLSLCLAFFAARCARLRLLVETDSESSMLAHHKAFSSVVELRIPLREARLTCAKFFICLRVRSMLRRFPPICICDLLGRGQVREAKSLAWTTFGLGLRVC